MLWIAGDVIVPPAMRRAARETGDGDEARGIALTLAPVAALWRRDGDDAYVIANLESPVARMRLRPDAFVHTFDGVHLVRSPLCVPPSVPQGLAAAGVDAVTLANNHILDQGREGLAETFDALRASGLAWVGAGPRPHHREPIVVGPHGARTAVVALLERGQAEPDLPDGSPMVALLDRGAVEDIRAARASADVVVAIVHVVGELRERPLRGWRHQIGPLVAAGADVVIVTGPHVPGPVERVRAGGREAVVAWTIGNLLSEMGRRATPRRVPRPLDGKWDTPRAREGLVARIEVEARPGGPPRVTTTFLPIWMHSDRDVVERHLLPRPIHDAVIPVAACGPALSLPGSWPEAERRAYERWIDARRDHLLRAARLAAPSPCPSEASLLAAP